MNIVYPQGNLLLLFYFDRAKQVKVKNETGGFKYSYRHEIIRCHLWFKGHEELQEFMKKHAPVAWDRSLFDNDDEWLDALIREPIETKWVDFYTMTKEELGLK
jgi:hypothetical protein